MAKTHVLRQNADIDVNSITIAGVAVNTAVLLASGQAVDLNGETGGLIFDTDANTKMYASANDVITINVAGASDFTIGANALTALSGSVIATNTISETTAASGVTIDSVLLKDGGIVCADAATLEVDTVNEATSAAGVTIDGLLVKDGALGAQQVISGDGAITIGNNAFVVLTKGSAGAITLAAPTAGTHDRFVIVVIAGSAQAHVITGSVDGFNAKGSSGTATFGGAIGDSVTFRAYNGHWYTTSKVNVTIA